MTKLYSADATMTLERNSNGGFTFRVTEGDRTIVFGASKTQLLEMILALVKSVLR